jgi:hypothetical protein
MMRSIERNALISDCRNALFRILVRHTGAGPLSERQLRIAEPRYEQFFQAAFEWNRILYEFWPDYGVHEIQPVTAPLYEQADRLFAGFLRAERGRVLVPVQPRQELAVLLFLALGDLWPVGNRWAPCDESSVEAVNAVKNMWKDKRDSGRSETKCWTVVMPTTMTVLQRDLELPGLECEKVVHDAVS